MAQIEVNAASYLHNAMNVCDLCVIKCILFQLLQIKNCVYLEIIL